MTTHRAHPVTSGPYCVANANLAVGTDPTAGQPSTFIRADVTCPPCVATYAPGWAGLMAVYQRAAYQHGGITEARAAWLAWRDSVTADTQTTEGE